MISATPLWFDVVIRKKPSNIYNEFILPVPRTRMLCLLFATKSICVFSFLSIQAENNACKVTCYYNYMWHLRWESLAGATSNQPFQCGTVLITCTRRIDIRHPLSACGHSAVSSKMLITCTSKYQYTHTGGPWTLARPTAHISREWGWAVAQHYCTTPLQLKSTLCHSCNIVWKFHADMSIQAENIRLQSCLLL